MRNPIQREDHMTWNLSRYLCAAAVALVATSYGAAPGRAADVIADWPTLQVPPPPTLKPATLDPKTTALCSWTS
jgi:hypothetical protein